MKDSRDKEDRQMNASIRNKGVVNNGGSYQSLPEENTAKITELQK